MRLRPRQQRSTCEYKYSTYPLRHWSTQQCPQPSAARNPNRQPLIMIKDEHGALALYFLDHARVAGEVLHGQVDLDYVKAREQGIRQVRVKLRGSIRTCVAF
jgi:hypothetical protein